MFRREPSLIPVVVTARAIVVVGLIVAIAIHLRPIIALVRGL